MHAITVTHTLDAAHRVVGHKAADGSPGKCARLHGHTYGFDIEMGGILDATGFVVDFGLVKALLDEWDHRLLLWDKDTEIGFDGGPEYEQSIGVVRLPFNPTAEHMAEHISKKILRAFEVSYVRATVRETAKTSAIYTANVLERENIFPGAPLIDLEVGVPE